MNITEVTQTISNLVEKQFPSFYREEGENFIAFVKAYYEWMEQSGYTINKSRQLFNIRDIDTTPNAFVEHFEKKYFANLPKNILGDTKFLQKHILDLYRSKGSNEGIRLLFRLLFNEEINIYIPSNDILKSSDGIWVEPKYIEISDEFDNNLYENSYITGVVSGATAYVREYKKIYIDDKRIQVLYITDVIGNFAINENLITDNISVVKSAKVLGSPESILITYGSPNQPVGDIVNSVFSFATTELSGVITDSYDVTDGYIDFSINSGGSKYSLSSNISITVGTNTTGQSATFKSFTLSNTEIMKHNLDVINYIPNDKTIYFNPNTDIINTSSFIKLANNVVSSSNNKAFANGDMIKYVCAPGNTIISGLSNNSFYYVCGSNSSGVQLSATYNLKTFNANTDVNNVEEFITINTNTFANGDVLRYIVSSGNTALVNLANNSYYYAIQANSTGVKLATSYTPISFNPFSSISNTDSYFISLSSHSFVNNDIVRYTTSYGNTAISALANNSYYYVVQSNTTGIKLSTTSGGAPILLYSNTLPKETGHNIYGPGTPINLTKGLSQNGHSFFGYSPIQILSNKNEFGHALVGRGIRLNSNTDITDATDFISISNNAFANGDQVTYHVINGNTALTNLTNNTIYWVINANTQGLKLATTYNGANINLTKGLTETGHFLTGVSKVDMLINVASFGSDLKNSNSNTLLSDALTDANVVVGTISKLTDINPGQNYNGDVTVRVRDNYTASYGLFDSTGKIHGNNAIISGKVFRGNDIPTKIKIKDSGFGHNVNGENISLINYANNSSSIDGNIVLGAIGVQQGYWLNDQGKLSDNKYIHDNSYYQEYSYEIQFSKSLDKYSDVLNQIMHPAGNKLFGKPVLLHFDYIPITIVNSSIIQV
jgi:hypothetical protein